MNIGWLVLSRMRTAVRRLCGQVSGLPSGVADQSWARVNAAISPPPARKSAALGRLTFNIRIDQRQPYSQPELIRLSQSLQTQAAAIRFRNIFKVREQIRYRLRGTN